MSLTLEKTECLNCRSHEFQIQDLDCRAINTNHERGMFFIPIQCPECKADMAFVFFNYDCKNAYGIAYEHTINDEPCYRDHCQKCFGTGGREK